MLAGCGCCAPKQMRRRVIEMVNASNVCLRPENGNMTRGASATRCDVNPPSPRALNESAAMLLYPSSYLG